MMIIDVSALGKLADSKDAKYSIEFVEKNSRIAKIELENYYIKFHLSYER